MEVADTGRAPVAAAQRADRAALSMVALELRRASLALGDVSWIAMAWIEAVM